MRVAVVFNRDEALLGGGVEDAIAVQAVVACASAVAESLRASGASVERIAIRPEPREILRVLANLDVDLVFNLVESIGGDPRLEAAFAGALELSGLAFTGSDPRALGVSLDKPLSRVVLAAAGVTVPRGATLARGDEPLDVPFPAIVKPTREDASHGIDGASVVRDVAAARARARFVIERYRQPALVEEFVDGREFNVALIGEGAGAELLSFGEIDFANFPADVPRIVTYAGKWIEGSDDWNRTLSGAAKLLAAAERAELERLARGAWAAIGGRDYGRVDLRLDARGRAFVIDVNPNPDLSPDAGFALAAQRSGRTHAQLVARIAELALERRAARTRGA
ncbi:MAG: ATP-grasp domain-containing protein [Planctomycetes bacterium]|nr:ATP-grasp domain-containing protein [Planctomycetota bacterium]